MEHDLAKVEHVAAMQRSNSFAAGPESTMPSPSGQTDLPLPPYSPPPEEKIPYDPSAAVARQRSQKEHNQAFHEWEDPSRSSDHKAHPMTGTLSSDMMQTLPPINHDPLDIHYHMPVDHDPQEGLNLPEPVVLSSLPQPVEPIKRRQTVASAMGSTMGSTMGGPHPYYTANEGMSATAFSTVTPLHLLADQPDMIDCPFCLRRAETKVVREASPMTHVLASICCLTTGLGVFAPYMLDWAPHIEQHCTNCNRRVTRKPHGKNEVQVFGTPPDQRITSRYPAAEYAQDDEVPPPPPAKNHEGPAEIYSGRD